MALSQIKTASIASGAVDTTQLAADAVDNTILDLADDFAGMHFGGTGTANQLDDYEEGTWTATVAGESGTITSYTVNSATYTKVGDTVYIFCRFQVTDKGTGSNFVVSGLPFSSARELLGTWAGTNTTGVTGFMFTAGTGATSFTSRRSSNWGDQCLFNESYTVQAQYRV